MSMNIKNPEAHRLALRIADLTGETVTGATFSRIPGGKGANQAVAAARLGAVVTLIGCVGNDDLAAEALTGLQAAGGGLDRLKRLVSPPSVSSRLP